MSSIVIAGGGIAGLEAMIVLRRHLGPEARIELLEPGLEFVERQLSVREPFDARPAPAADLVQIVGDHHAHLHPDRLRAVEPQDRRVLTVRGDTLTYDALLVAVGARPDVAVAGALTFRGRRDVQAFGRLLDDLVAYRARSVAFAVPAGVAWALPLYELALMTAEHLHERGVKGTRIMLVTPERDPLDGFGPGPSSRVRALFAQRGIALRTERIPLRVGAHGLEIDHDRPPITVDRVVALPRPGGPWLSGLPHDTGGFLPVDEHCAVRGVDGVWAAGDGTSFPIKQGGIAAQQADAAAEAIAAYLGARIDPQPFRPVLRGLLLDPRGSRYLQVGTQELSDAPLWWPPTKVAAEHLAPYLSAGPERLEPREQVVDVGQLLLSLAAQLEAVDEHALALRCLDAAEQVGAELGPDVAALRREIASR